ncbi:MAG: hypothetical protein H7A33_06960 [Deltaproteobacteria bacterium]|nr:hypothetical protein [Deltaproteobacteria bacterium]
MKHHKYFILWSALASLLFCVPVFAKADTLKITAANFDEVYQGLRSEFDAIEQNTRASLLRRFKRHRGTQKYRYSKEEALLRDRYLSLEEQLEELEPVRELRDSLKAIYLDKMSLAEERQKALHAESTWLAVSLINKTAELKEKYKSIFIPIVHNMMIDVGVRKRGACKHWAEDLLEYLRPQERRFFDITWGEANVGKITEHNVAVLVPRTLDMQEGLVYDPWRTGGKPFWVRVKEDSHYNWIRWVGYGTF